MWRPACNVLHVTLVLLFPVDIPPAGKNSDASDPILIAAVASVSWLFHRFANGINGLAGKQEELAKHVNSLGGTSTDYGMEMSAEKTKFKSNK